MPYERRRPRARRPRGWRGHRARTPPAIRRRRRSWRRPRRQARPARPCRRRWRPGPGCCGPAPATPRQAMCTTASGAKALSAPRSRSRCVESCPGSRAAGHEASPRRQRELAGPQQDRHLVPPRQEVRNEIGAQKAARAGDKNTHGPRVDQLPRARQCPVRQVPGPEPRSRHGEHDPTLIIRPMRLNGVTGSRFDDTGVDA